MAPDLQTLRLVATTTGGTFSEAPSSERLQEVYRELGTRLAHDRKRVEVTSAFAAGGAVLLLLGGALVALVQESAGGPSFECSPLWVSPRRLF